MAAAEQPSITLATRQDVPEILAMIQALAAHENQPDQVRATEDSLHHTLTFAPPAPGSPQPTTPASPTPPGSAQTLILRLPAQLSPADHARGFHAGAVAGMALFFHSYSTWTGRPGVYLEDLFVRPPYRRRGYGRLLMRALAAEARRVDGARLDWRCATANAPALRFYASLGAVRLDHAVQLRLDGRALETLAAVPPR